MVTSMTGYGRGEASSGAHHVSVELRSVNNRFLEIALRLPRSLSLRENDCKEIIRRTITRGKINATVTLDRGGVEAAGLHINPETAKAYYRLLRDLKKALKLREPIRLAHLLQFSEILEQEEEAGADEAEWALTRSALDAAVADLHQMRQKEGRELENDFRARIALLNERLNEVERLSKEQVPRERERLKERIRQLLDTEHVDEGRLELEVALLADRLDVTEECVRFRSHNKFFLEALDSNESPGRRLNFLVQEINREANTIGSKSNAQEIAHIVVGIKEELEKIREQLQNIE
ncbi:MAG: YicC family protein [Bacteroidetes bacterium]|nr:YicC family protein [Bacteroidota bacterium]